MKIVKRMDSFIVSKPKKLRGHGLLLAFIFLLSSFFPPSIFPFFSSAVDKFNFLNLPPFISGQNSLSEDFSSEEGPSWYVVTLGGVPVGYAREESKKVMTPEGYIIRSFSELKLTVRRLGAKVELSSSSETEERENGELVRCSLLMKLSNLETVTRAEVREKEIIIHSSTFGQKYSQKISFDGRLLGPAGINRLTLNFLKKPGDQIEYATYLPEVNQVIKARRKAEDWESLKLSSFNSLFKALRVVETIETLSIKRTLWFEEGGKLIQSEEISPMGELKIYLASREEALVSTSAKLLMDIPFESTLVKANVRLPSARAIKRIKLRLKFREGEVILPAYTSSYQRVLSIEKDSLILEIESPPIRAQETDPYGESKDEKQLGEYLQANTYVNIDDPLIKKIAKELCQNILNDWEKALKLRDWVSQNISFDAGIVFAPATEVIRQRRGTCVSFAILLTALARAAGFPARIIMGYAYLNGVWGGHAWAEIYLDRNWFPFDAALPSPGVADAARVALVTSSFNSGLGEIIAAGQRFFSKVGMEILEFQLGNRIFKAPQVLFEIRGKTYINPGLGLEVNVPDFLTLEETNKAWPNNTLLVMKNEREEVRLLQQSWRPVSRFEDYLRQLAGADFSKARIEIFSFHGRKAYRLKNKNQAVAFFFQGTDLWQVSVRSPKALSLLDKALGAIHFKIKIPLYNRAEIGNISEGKAFKKEIKD